MKVACSLSATRTGPACTHAESGRSAAPTHAHLLTWSGEQIAGALRPGPGQYTSTMLDCICGSQLGADACARRLLRSSDLVVRTLRKKGDGRRTTARRRRSSCKLATRRPDLCCSCWKYALESTGFDPLVDLDGFDPLWCKSPNGPQML
jgi:hypothetical protein